MQTTFATATDRWTPISFGPEWAGLTSVTFASDQDFLAVDNIDVVPVPLPEPGVAIGLVVGAGFLAVVARRKSRFRER